MGLTLESPKADPPRDGIGEVLTLRVVASGYRLDVGESRPVLDVQQRTRSHVPRDDIGPTRELVMLIRLVDARAKAVRPKASDLKFGHRAVDDIRVVTPVHAPTRIDDVDPDLQGECPCDPYDHVERTALACLDPVHGRGGDPAPCRKFRQRPVASPTFVTNRVTDGMADARQGEGDRIGGIRGGRSW